jgi:uncharacterized membrane protein YfcA
MLLAGASVGGAVVGAVLLLELPASAFQAIVPVFIAIALVLIVAQPRVSAWRASRGRHRREQPGWIATVVVFAGGVYGGYFGAAQGILVTAVLTLSVDDELQRLNAVKVVLTGLVNLVSGVVFIFAAHIAWAPAGLIAAGSLIGGALGARFGRRLKPSALRAIIVVVGIAAIIHLLA